MSPVLSVLPSRFNHPVVGAFSTETSCSGNNAPLAPVDDTEQVPSLRLRRATLQLVLLLTKEEPRVPAFSTIIRRSTIEAYAFTPHY